MQNLQSFVSNLITRTPIQYFPVTVKKGVAKGARWTLFPYSSYWRGNTELDVESAIKQYSSIRGSTCWDLGTHFGIYTVGMAMAVGSEGMVFGFEPDPVAFKRCQRHIQMNSLNQVKLVNAAVSNLEGSFELILDGGIGNSTSHLAYEDEQLSKITQKVTVKTVVLDNLVESGVIQPAQFIKVDIEGHGDKAVFGARKTIASHRPTIVMSFHSQQELNGTKEILQPLGYRSFSVEGKELEWQDSLFCTTVLRC